MCGFKFRSKRFGEPYHVGFCNRMIIIIIITIIRII